MASTNMFNNNYLSLLENKGVIQLTGEERVKYLQGQVTSDIEKLGAGQAQLSCHCDFKGKTWNVFYALQHQDAILMLSHQESIPASLAELKKYGVFAKVDIQDNSDHWVCLGGAGIALESLIKTAFGDIPNEDKQILSNELGLVMCLQQPQTRYLLLLTEHAAESFISEYDTELNSDGRWELEDIQAGIPEIRSTTSNEFVPQMMNLQALDAICFSKGCYMGQETVARTKFLGKNKRAAFILVSEEVSELSPGDTLESQAGDNWRRGGTVLRSVSVKRQGGGNAQTWLLAVVANDSDIGATFRSKEQPELLFTVQALPYSLE
jgi:folate-binding protein YgfZ